MSLLESVDDLRKAASLKHDAPVAVRAVLLGCGRVGQAVAALAEARRADLRAAGVDLRFRCALVRDPRKPRAGPPLALTTTADGIFDDADVAVEVIGGTEPACTLVRSAIERGVAVVTANKSLVAAHGAELRRLAHDRQVAFACEAAVVAGVPFVGALASRPLFARARRLAGVLNGTTNFVLTELARGATRDEAIAAATAHGYAEPDCRSDFDGRDAAEKLAILLQLCGWSTTGASLIPRAGIDDIDSVDLESASRLDGTIKPVAIASLDDHARVSAWAGPAFVSSGHPLARASGVENILTLTGATGDRVTYSGPGAGPLVTAATILDDVIEVVGKRRPPLVRAAPTTPPPRPPYGGWLLRFVRPPGISVGRLLARLARRRLASLRVATADARVYVLTTPATARTVQDALAGAFPSPMQTLALPAITEN